MGNAEEDLEGYMITAPLFDAAIPVWLVLGLPLYGPIILLVLAVLIEALVLSWLHWEKPIITSFIMNLASMIAGFCNPLGLSSMSQGDKSYWMGLFAYWILIAFALTLVIEGIVLFKKKGNRNIGQILSALLLANLASYAACYIAAMVLTSLEA